jgi:uncharacterized protein (DUF1330 family)
LSSPSPYAKRISKGSKKGSKPSNRAGDFNVAGYLIANIDVTEPAKFEEYREKVMPLIEKFGGRYLVRGGDVRRQFPTLEAAQRFYDSAEYQPILKLRLDSTRSDVVLAQGYSQ